MGKSSVEKSHKSFGLLDFIWRLAGSLILVFATYNPTGHSYIHWFKNAWSADSLGAQHFFVGSLLIAGWAILIVATGNSLGKLGTVIGAALIGTGIWFLAQLGVVHADSATAITWLALVALATLLAIGLSWSHIWRRLSGQVEVADND